MCAFVEMIEMIDATRSGKLRKRGLSFFSCRISVRSNTNQLHSLSDDCIKTK